MTQVHWCHPAYTHDQSTCYNIRCPSVGQLALKPYKCMASRTFMISLCILPSPGKDLVLLLCDNSSGSMLLYVLLDVPLQLN